MEDNAPAVNKALTALRQRLPQHIAVSAKIRLPLNPAEQEERIQRLVDTRINFLTVHGRDLTENKTKVSHVRIDRLRAAVETAANAGGVPVIANGGIESLDDVTKLLSSTSAAAVMSSEALLERPNLFATAVPATPQDRFDEQMRLAESYLQWARYAPPLPGVLGVRGGSFNIVRGHLFKILYRYLQDYTDLRDALANSQQFVGLEQAEHLLRALRKRYASLSDDEWEAMPSSNYPESSWYRRHWGASDRVHQKQRKHGDSALQNEQQRQLLSVEERKQLVKERIAVLKLQKKTRSRASLPQ